MDELFLYLKDAGCGAERISEIRRLCEAGDIADAIRRLRRHRCELMDELHKSQGKLDCLDDLLRKMERSQGRPERKK